MARSSSETPPAVELRDYLAGQIISGLLTAPSRPGVPLLTRLEMASAAYQLADAMLEARGK